MYVHVEADAQSVDLARVLVTGAKYSVLERRTVLHAHGTTLLVAREVSSTGAYENLLVHAIEAHCLESR